MIRKRFNKDQILQILEKHKEGVSIKERIEKYRISQAIFIIGEQNMAMPGLDIPQELKSLKEDNERFKTNVCRY